MPNISGGLTESWRIASQVAHAEHSASKNGVIIVRKRGRPKKRQYFVPSNKPAVKANSKDARSPVITRQSARDAAHVSKGGDDSPNGLLLGSENHAAAASQSDVAETTPPSSSSSKETQIKVNQPSRHS